MCVCVTQKKIYFFKTHDASQLLLFFIKYCIRNEEATNMCFTPSHPHTLTPSPEMRLMPGDELQLRLVVSGREEWKGMGHVTKMPSGTPLSSLLW